MQYCASRELEEMQCKQITRVSGMHPREIILIFTGKMPTQRAQCFYDVAVMMLE